MTPFSVTYAQGSTQPVFPGAEGFGTNTVAGRGGEICLVENLHDSGEGSLRHCVEKKGPRVVIFTLGGTITVKTTLIITEPFISIYGQTATGDGIMLRADEQITDQVLSVTTHDVLIQHLRLRAGPSVEPACCRDALSIANKVPGEVYNVVVDHVSMSWGTDEVADIWYDSNNITISNSIISEGLNQSTNKGKNKTYAGRGFIIGSEGSHSISFHHNFMAHNYQRNPLVKSSGVTDVVNNLVYHWTSRAAQVAAAYGPLKANFVKNMFIAVPSDIKRQNSDKRWSDISVTDFGNDVDLYLEGNYGYRRTLFFQSQERLLGIEKEEYNKSYDYISDTRHPAPPISEMPAKDLEEELIKDVGATLPKQDATDLRLFYELKTRTGKMPDCVTALDPPSFEICKNNAGGWPEYKTGDPRIDTDRDGMPDDWELANDLDATDPTDAISFHSSGYTNIDRWVHSLSE